MTITLFQKTILDWYTENKRDLPFRNTKDPYKILVSEVMLQQTQMSRVLPKYEEFLQAFPTLEALAKASDKKLLKVWQGLGYWRRAKYLKETARTLVQARATNSKTSFRSSASTVSKSGGARTQSAKSRWDFDARSFGISSLERLKQLEQLPGIGPYTARALACFAFGSREAFLDTNIRRVYLHFFFPKKENVSDKEILEVAQKVIDALPKNVSAREWHYALFDYGSAVLKNKTINKQSKHYTKQSKFEGSFRSFRTKVMQELLASPRNKLPQKSIQDLLQKELKESKFTSQEILTSLLKDQLIKESKTHYSI